MPPTPKPILIAALVISALAGLSALYGVGTAFSADAWFAVGFETVILVSGVFGVLVGLGKFRESHALALVCVAGAIFVCACLSFISGDADVAGNAQIGLLVRAMPRDPVTGARIAAALLLTVLSGLILIQRRPVQSFRYLGLGVAFGAVPLLAVIAALIPGVRNAFANLHQVLLAVLLFVAFFAVGALVSVSLHCFIRAFEVGRIDPKRDDAPATAA